MSEPTTSDASPDPDHPGEAPGKAALDNIVIVLSAPAYGGNVGAICRAMKNMGLSRLRIGNPRGNLDMDELRKMALHALPIYEAHEEFATVAEAIADCTTVAAASARVGLYRHHARSPKAWAPEWIKEAAAGGTVGVLFGSEASGLPNDELRLAQHLIQIPSSPEFSALNLSKAVMICAYEIYVASGVFEGAVEYSPQANNQLREIMFAAWKETMLDIGFVKHEKSEHMMMGLRRILSRGALTEKDAKILLGLARQAQWAATQNADEAPPETEA